VKFLTCELLLSSISSVRSRSQQWHSQYSVVAEEIRKRNEAENIAPEDVEQMVLEVATNLWATVEFDGAEIDATPT
jgi:hypothetical protein